MKKIIPFVFFIITGCSVPGGMVDAVNPVNFFETGFYPLLIIAELETNLSSVIIDKTKAKIQDFSVNPYEILPEGSVIYVMPVKITQTSKQSWDTYYSQMIINYIKMNNFAKITDDIETTDYVLFADISESPEVWNGTNYSKINMTIMERNETPVFYTKINVTSKSDKNFYYHPSKSARPVKELTLFGLEEIFREGLPQAFGTDDEEN
ncbi:MAG: hypothetical protein IJD28_04815 [Deferribacterales bacterium]|nr:hypothetical protein [Deferribacterales bacterium]